ncbi:MAG: hypothetical protein HOP11_14830, partial [Saprospiraceae bacterium]|nr:hypothetical protein [Saprospiraceae bacterium]
MNEEKIYQYLLGEMNPEETVEFEKELQNDKELQKQLEELNLVIGNIKKYPQHDLKKRLVEIEKNTYKESF